MAVTAATAARTPMMRSNESQEELARFHLAGKFKDSGKFDMRSNRVSFNIAPFTMKALEVSCN